MIDPDIRHIIEAELAEGEELLWAESPQRHSYVILLSALAWCLIFGGVFLLPSIWAIIKNDPSGLIFDLNGVPASQIEDTRVLIPWAVFTSLIITAYPAICFHQSRRYGYSTYALSNKHVYIHRPNWPRKTLKLDPLDFDIGFAGNAKRGSLFFKSKSRSILMKLFAPTGSFLNPAFFKIQNPKSVLELIERREGISS